MADEQMSPGLVEREKRRAERIQQVRASAGLPPVRVLPANDTLRKVLRHPSNNIGFPAEGSAEWPNDSFTQLRLRDGDITLTETPAEHESRSQSDAASRYASDAASDAASRGYAETHSSQGSAEGGSA